MTELLERALEAIRRIPDHEQGSIARTMLEIIGAAADIPSDDLPDVLLGIAEADRGA